MAKCLSNGITAKIARVPQNAKLELDPSEVTNPYDFGPPED